MFDYDSASGWLIRKFRNGYPYNKPSGHKPTHSAGYGTLGIDGKMYLSHLVIWLLVNGTYPDGEIDHIDRNRINNRIDNLREISSSGNQHNRIAQKNNISGFSGVYWDKINDKYLVQICANHKTIHIGRFFTLEEAILAAKKAKIEYHPSSPQAKQYAEELGITIQ